MKISTTLPLLLSSAVSSVVAQSVADIPVNPKLGFTPGIGYPDSCRQKPGEDLCPPFLANGNLVVTGLNLVLVDTKPDQGPSQGSNIFRVGWDQTGTTEEITLTVFDFPHGFEKKNCTFQIITNGGDQVAGSTVYSVWSLKDKGKDVNLNTTWKTKPPRDEVVAVAIDNLSQTGFLKDTFKFLYGAGSNLVRSTQTGLPSSFVCPPGGKIVFETAQTAKIPTSPFSSPLNAGGNGGLVIEILNTEVFLARPT
ncbi:hypothetical protein L873DRAFT_1802358 [Choiromyces venosus 120613-1]|uniref:Ubiquitin 3 binding protein But2 C-terminal domain-containing protein n=1 Tax=Choiromyces venosus 120613-1 TaxID=1336337 RepID=A0A3N4JVN8_9PEZI|nr:hypothetical protein L873DRAFT_1802358 [Choiromyces venosus 120613-1]